MFCKQMFSSLPIATRKYRFLSIQPAYFATAIASNCIHIATLNALEQTDTLTWLPGNILFFISQSVFTLHT